MSTETTRVGLYKPEAGENVNVTTDLNNNLDLIDTNLNFRVVASATARNAISPIWEGLTVRETDTGRCYVSNGTLPVSGSWTEILLITSDGIDLEASRNLQLTGSSTGEYKILSYVSGDAFHRFAIASSGSHRWGDGTGGTDVALYRSSAGLLRVEGGLTVDTSLNVGGTYFPTIQYKTTDTSRTSTTVLADDPDLTTTVEAGGSYLVEFSIMYEGGPTGKIKTTWTVPASTTGVRGVTGPGSTANDNDMDNVTGRFGAHNFDTSIEYGVRSTTGFEVLASETGVINVTETGTLALAWAQVASDTTATRVTTGSWLRVTRLV